MAKIVLTEDGTVREFDEILPSALVESVTSADVPVEPIVEVPVESTPEVPAE